MSDLYQTKEWKSLDPTGRTYLLPVMEDVRPGALVRAYEPEYEILEYLLKEKGLKISKEKDDLTWLVSKNERLLETTCLARQLFPEVQLFYTAEERLDKKFIVEAERTYHKSMGKFFGYPDCCVENFIDTLAKGLLPNLKWNKKAGKALTEGKYDPLFDYVLYVPCGLDCKGTLSLAKDIKSCLETYDPEAEDILKNTNRKSIERFAKCTTT